MTQILVVDDEVAIREVLIEFLSDHGYAVQGAEDGREALQMAGIVRPQVILLDIAMPGMNGIETLKRLFRSRSSWPTARRSPSWRRRAASRAYASRPGTGARRSAWLRSL